MPPFREPEPPANPPEPINVNVPGQRIKILFLFRDWAISKLLSAVTSLM